MWPGRKYYTSPVSPSSPNSFVIPRRTTTALLSSTKNPRLIDAFAPNIFIASVIVGQMF